jgi:hypothetical protein
VAALALGIPLLFDPAGSDGFILPRASLLIAGAGAAVALAVWSRPTGAGGLAAPAFAVAATALLACLTSVDPSLSLAGAYERYDGAVTRLAYLGLFAASAWFLRTPADRRRAVSWFLVACCVVAAEALWQLAGDRQDRPDGYLGQPNLLGVLLAMAVPLALNRARGERRWLLAAGLVAAGLLASGSRSAWLGAVAGCGALLVFLAPPGRRRRAAAAGALLALGIGVALVLGTQLRNLGHDTGSGRLHVWADSAGLIAARPATGWGEDSVGLVFGRFQRGDWENGQTFDRLHSEPLDLLATQGVAGALAAAWFWGVLWRRLAVRLRVEEAGALGAAWIAYAAWALLNFDWAPVTGPLWLLAGVAWAAAAEPAAGSEPPRAVPRWAAAPLTALLCAVVVGLGLLPPLADRLELAGDHLAATRLDPLQAYYHEQAGVAAIDAGDPAMAEAELTRAAALGEDDAGAYVELGDVEAGLGRPDQARRAYQRAVALDPYYAEARHRLGSG